MRLLLIEGSRELAAWLANVLRSDGNVVDCARDDEAAENRLQLAAFDLVALDLAANERP